MLTKAVTNSLPRQIICCVLAALVMSAWTVFSWTFWQPFYDLSPESAVLDAVKELHLETEVYRFPAIGTVEGTSATSKLRWLEKATTGPFGYLIVRPEGVDPTASGVYIRNFLIHLGAAAAAMYLLSLASVSSFGRRFKIIVVLGAVLGVFFHLQQWNWLFFPLGYSLKSGLEAWLCWILAGPLIAFGFSSSTKKGA